MQLFTNRLPPLKFFNVGEVNSKRKKQRKLFFTFRYNPLICTFSYMFPTASFGRHDSMIL